MRSPSVKFLLVLLAVSMAPVCLHAQDRVNPVSQLTAEDLYIQSINEYNAGNYEAAAKGFLKFEADYGKSTQSAAPLAKMRFPLAMSLLHLQKFEDAAEQIDLALKSDPPPTAEQKEDLMFYKGVCEMQQEDYEKARESLASFVKEFPKGHQVAEALLLAGTSYILEEKYDEAAQHFAAVKGSMDPISRGRASVLQLYALVAQEKNDEALAVIVEEFPRLDQMLQIATFQTLALQVGSSFLEQEQYRKAIQALQRVWPQQRLMEFQEQRLTELEAQLEAAELQPKSDPFRKFELKQMIAKIEREVESLGKIESFDAALRLRLASAYQAMERYREAALIMDDMLNEMPPDPVVESGSVNLVQSWLAIERWPKAIAAAKTFEEKFPKSKQRPLVLYLQGIAEQQANDQAAAIATFARVHKDFPKSEFAARAFFMQGFSQLLAEQNKEAIATFEAFAKEYPKHELAEPAAYWRGMGYSLDKQFEKTREVMDEYLAKYPEGSNRGLALFRKAYAAQSMKDYSTSTGELLAYLREYPDHESTSEALILLGDAYMATGNMDRGIATFARIPPRDTRFFEEGYFKTGKAYRLMEEPDKLRAHFEAFAAEHPRSSRVGEAIYWVGWTYRQAGDNEKAREAYWAAIDAYGNDPSIRTIDDLFPALRKLYSGDEEEAQYVAALRDLKANADAEDDETLAMRALWAQAQFYGRSDPGRAQQLLIDALTRVEPSSTNPLLMADFADALERAGRADDAEQMWRDLVKWNPRAPQKDRALAALGAIEEKRGNDAKALAEYDRFERETSGSLLFGQVMLAKAALLEKRGDNEAARKALEALLENSYTPGNVKAQALYQIGSLYMKEGKPGRAVPYFQRIYIMHTRWGEWVAKAYLTSGQAFEELEDIDAAKKTYEEMTKLDDLSEYPETKTARERLEAIGG